VCLCVCVGGGLERERASEEAREQGVGQEIAGEGVCGVRKRASERASERNREEGVGKEIEASRVRVKADHPGRRWPEAPNLSPLRLDRPSRLSRDRACGSCDRACGSLKASYPSTLA
jgi:hypothetical protein